MRGWKKTYCAEMASRKEKGMINPWNHSQVWYIHVLVTVCTLIFAGFNVCGFRGSAAICEYFVREYLDITVNGHTVHRSSQSMTSCVTKMMIIGYRANSLR